MKPFNLEAAKAGATVQTRSGKAARILCFDLRTAEYPLVVAVAEGNREFISEYTAAGKYYEEATEESGFDLFMAPVQRTVWVPLYHSSISPASIVAGSAYDSEQAATAVASNLSGYMGVFPITFEE